MVNHPRRNRRLPYAVFKNGERVAMFDDYEHACRYALAESRGPALVDVVNKTGIIDQYEGGKATPGQPGFAMKNWVTVRDSREYRELAAATEGLLRLVKDMSCGVGKMALQDYQLFNEAPIAAQRALDGREG